MRYWLVLGGMEWYWLIYDGTGSVQAGTGWYLVVLGQYREVRVDMMLLGQY